jgi:hypothetical protein
LKASIGSSRRRTRGKAAASSATASTEDSSEAAIEGKEVDKTEVTRAVKANTSSSDSNSVVGCLEATNALLESVWRVLSIVRDITDAKVWIFSMCQSVVLLCIR